MKKAGFLARTFLAGLCIQSAALAEPPMTFRIDPDDDDRIAVQVVKGGIYDVYAVGEITEGTTERFLAFVRDNQIDAAKVHFNSAGGSLGEGIKLGRAIRTMKFFTAVGVYHPTYESDRNADSICASACAYAFAGGISRFLDQHSGKLGLHQFYSAAGSTVSEEAIQQVSGLIVAYLDEMGVDARAFTLSTVADRNGMIWLTPKTALMLRFANNGSQPPVAEIRLVGMVPYLRIEQEHHNVTTRVLFNCSDRRIHMSFGIVTDPQHTKLFLLFPKRSYFELDDEEFLPLSGNAGVEGVDSVAWIKRNLTPATLRKVMAATVMDGWIDGSGVVRYGAGLEVGPVREKILEFGKQCYAE